jgi:hypothetical protein
MAVSGATCTGMHIVLLVAGNNSIWSQRHHLTFPNVLRQFEKV